MVGHNMKVGFPVSALCSLSSGPLYLLSNQHQKSEFGVLQRAWQGSGLAAGGFMAISCCHLDVTTNV